MPQDPRTQEEVTLDRLTRSVDRVYNNPGNLMWRSFLAGVMSGLGATIGVALILSIGGYVFSLLGGIELLRPGLTEIRNMIIPKEYRLPFSGLTMPSDRA